MSKKKIVPQDVYCDYCGRKTEFVDSKIIYGQSYGMIYLCRNCMAYVGVHKGSAKPLGRLANAQLRYWKKQAHAAFDPLWKYGRFKNCRNVAYAWLAKRWACRSIRPTSACLTSVTARGSSQSVMLKGGIEMSGNPLLAGEELVSSLIISNDEYAELIEAKTQLDLIIACAGDDGFGAVEIIKAVKKARGLVITTAMAQE